MKRISFTLDESRAREAEVYAWEHGYGSVGDFARVAMLRIMRMYPPRRDGSTKHTADKADIAPGVPHTQQEETSWEARPMSKAAGGAE
jgi:hypothetical protein